MRRTRLSAIALGAAIVTLAVVPHVHAQSAGDSQAGAQYKAGQDAFANGNYKAAVGHFAKVLRNSELESAAVAKALYMRGLSHEKAGQPAQAIADLTNALFLSGLSRAERAKAYLSRGKAYEAVGMAKLGSADVSRARSGGVSEQQIARAAQKPRSGGGNSDAPSFATSVSSAGSGASTPSFSTRSNSRRTRETAPTFATSSQTTASRAESAPPPSNTRRTASFQTRSNAPSRDQEIPQFRTSILPQETPAQNRRAASPPPARTARSSGSAPAGWDTSVAQQQAAQPQAQAEEPESGTRVGRWFRGLRNNVTGRDEKPETTSAPAPSAPAPTTAAAPRTAAAPPPQWSQTTTASRTPQPSWNSQVSAPARPQRTAAAPQAAAPAAAPRPSSGAGGYRIQLAALRSDAEAQATWKRLQAKHGALLGNYQPNIVKTELGGLGTFYRVQLGPFSDKAATQQLCKNFKSGGLDCFLLAQ